MSKFLHDDAVDADDVDNDSAIKIKSRFSSKTAEL